MEEYKNMFLGDVSSVTKLAGFEFTKYIKYNATGEIIALRALNLRKGELNLSDIKRIDREVSDGLQRSKLFVNDILLTYTGNGYGDCAIIDENDKYHLAPNICKIVPDVEKVNPYYLYLFIRSNKFYKTMSNYMVGSSQPTIPMKIIRQLPILVPSCDVQNKIVELIKPMDEQIRNNKKIIENIVKQILRIYKYMFIDLEPFGFELPSEWKKQSLLDNDITKVIKPGVDKFDEKIYFATSDITKLNYSDGDVVEYETRETRANMQPKIHSVWFAKMKNSIKHLFVTESAKRIADSVILSTGFFGMQCEENSFEYVASFIMNPKFEILKDSLAHGTTQEAVNQDDINKIEFIVPSPEVLEQYHNLTKGFFEEIYLKLEENKKIIIIRNNLVDKILDCKVEL